MVMKNFNDQNMKKYSFNEHPSKSNEQEVMQHSSDKCTYNLDKTINEIGHILVKK